MGGQPAIQQAEDGFGFLLSESPSRLIIEFGDFPLNAIELPEELEGLAGDLALVVDM